MLSGEVLCDSFSEVLDGTLGLMLAVVFLLWSAFPLGAVANLLENLRHKTNKTATFPSPSVAITSSYEGREASLITRRELVLSLCLNLQVHCSLAPCHDAEFQRLDHQQSAHGFDCRTMHDMEKNQRHCLNLAR